MRPYPWLALFLASLYFVLGAYGPFWALWLASIGLSAEQIGLLIGLGLAVRFPGNLLIMSRISGAEGLLPMCRRLALLSLLSFAGFYVLRDFSALLLLTLVANFIYPTLIPLSDALSARMMLQVQLDYGKVRLWGSLAFVTATVLVGAVVQQGGADWILHIMVLGLLLPCVLSWVPLVPAPEALAEGPSRVSYWSLLRQRDFQRFLLIVSLLLGSHAAYNGFSTLYWQSQGYDASTIGYLWAVGVVAEILMFAFSRRLLGHMSPQQLLLIAAGACVLRWLTLGLTTALPWLLLVQSLHAVTFCFTHLAAMRHLTLALPREQVIPAQTLYAALPGVVMAGLTVLTGTLYTEFAGGIFLVMALIAAPALLLRVQAPVPRLAVD